MNITCVDTETLANYSMQPFINYLINNSINLKYVIIYSINHIYQMRTVRSV